MFSWQICSRVFLCPHTALISQCCFCHPHLPTLHLCNSLYQAFFWSTVEGNDETKPCCLCQALKPPPICTRSCTSTFWGLRSLRTCCVPSSLTTPNGWVEQRYALKGYLAFKEIRAYVFILVTICALQVSDDGRYVLLSIREGCDPVNRLWYCDLQTTPQGITGVFNCYCFLTLFIYFLSLTKTVTTKLQIQCWLVVLSSYTSLYV